MKRIGALSAGLFACLLAAPMAFAQAPIPDNTPAAKPVADAVKAESDPAVVDDAAVVDEAPAVPVGPRTFLIDKRKSSLVLQVFKEGAAAALAHDHVVSAGEIRGMVILDAADHASARVDVEVTTKGLVNDDPKVRKRFGLDPAMPDKDRADVLEHMRADGQLDVAKYPVITFVSTSVVPGEGDKMTLTGKFTLHGVTKEVKLPITVKATGDVVEGRGSMRFNTSDYGIEPYSAFFGAVKNKDGVILTVHLVATAKK